jgi:outer membrane protein TolC
MHRVLCFLLVSTLCAVPLGAQTQGDTLHLTLDAAVRRALDRGEEMRLVRAQVLEADGGIREAFAGGLPQLTGSLVYTRQFASIFQGTTTDTSEIARLFKNTPFGAANQWSFQLQASQLLFSGGKVGAGLSAARALRRGATQQEAQTAADVTLAVRQAYYDAATAVRLVEIAEANLGQARDHERQVRLYHQAGTRAEYDLLRAQVDAANQEPTVVAARNADDLALRELKRLLNIPIGQPVTLETPLVPDDATIPVVAEDSLALVLDASTRPAIAAAEAAVSVREQAVRAAQADRWPTLSVATTYSQQAFPQNVFPATDQFRRGWNGEVKLSFPIFLGFRTSGAIARAQAGLLRARAERDQVREQVALDVAQAQAELRRTRALLAARRETVRLAERARYLAGVRYANGLATEVEVSDARVLARQAEVNEVQAARDYLVALAQLERALGRPVPVVRRPIDQLAQAPNVKERQP